MISRADVSAYLATGLERDREASIRRAAAWLAARGRHRQASYVVRGAAAELARRGHVAVTATTAHPLSVAARTELVVRLRRELGAETIELNERVEPGLVGGIKLETPTAVRDDTVDRRLQTFVTKGTSR